MTAPKVIWAWPIDGGWEMECGHWDCLHDNSSPEQIGYIRADATELVALVDAAKDALTVLEEYHMGSSSPVICDLVAALAAYEALK